VRLAGTVVTDDQHAFVIDRRIERQLRNNQLFDALGHVIRNNVGRDQFVRCLRPIGVEQLDDRFNRLELDEIGVAHACLVSGFKRQQDYAVHSEVLIFGMIDIGISQPALVQSDYSPTH